MQERMQPGLGMAGKAKAADTHA
ncbi:MAG: hypothetical protein JWQ76_2043, partial [Ramlibacter sp.]|nr:hypothetical protein [Ramlibacter sp.]